MKRFLIFLILLFLIFCLSAAAEVTKGNLLLNTATKDASYPGTIETKKDVIIIKCRLHIFREFNNFNAPFSKTLIINRTEVKSLERIKGKVFIIPKTTLYKRYRNYFCQTYKIRRYLEPGSGKGVALVFITQLIENKIK